MPRGLGTRLSTILLLIGLIIFGTRSHAEEVALAWDANRESDLEGYGVYFKAGADGPPYDFFGYVGISDLSDADSPAFTVSGLQPNTTYHFAITAYDTAGNESAFSASVCAEVGPVVTPCAAPAGRPLRRRHRGEPRQQLDRNRFRRVKGRWRWRKRVLHPGIGLVLGHTPGAN